MWYGHNSNIISSVVITDESGTVEPVTVQQIKDYMRLEGWNGDELTFDDELIAELNHNARIYIEEAGNISLVPHNVEVVLSNYDRIELPFSPIDEILSITDDSDNEFDEDLIKTVGNERKYLIRPVGCDLTVSYSTTATDDTRPLTDIKRLVYFMYENRGASVDEASAKCNLMLPSYSRKSVVP